MKTKVVHLAVIALAVVGAFYVFHMYFHHSGQSLIPGK